MRNLFIGILFGYILGALSYLHYYDKKKEPILRDRIEAAYVLGCYIGVDMVLSNDRNIKTCNQLKYYGDKKWIY